MANFLFLFWHNQNAWKPTSPQEMERRTRAWMSWMEDLRKSDHFVKAGERLDPSGRSVRGAAKTVIDGPYAESKDLVGGYCIVEADDLDRAAELAKGCPILDAGGGVEVRPIISL